MPISPFLRQITVALSAQLAAISVGGAITYPTLLIDSFRSSNGTTVDVDTTSWLGSMSGLAGIPAILLPMIAQKIGRKYGYIVTCLLLIVGWSVACSASTVTQLLISETFQGLSTNSLMPICFMGISEMLAPKYRAYSMQTFGISLGLGMAACGILGRYFDYTCVGKIMLVPIVAATAIALLWPESPAWCAYKGQFRKCEREFAKLRGTDELSQRELLELIKTNQEILSRRTKKSMITFWKQILSRDFYMPSIDTFILFLAIYWSGCNVIYIYFIEILMKSTNNQDAVFYTSVAMYIIALGGLIIRDILLLKFQNKTMVKFSACCVIICLLICSLISGCQTLGVLSEGSLLLLYSLVAYTASANLGLNGIVFIIAAELMPVKHRSLGGGLYIVINCILYASSLKISPYVTEHIGLWCTFLIFALNGSICLWYIWKYVPETKGRSLQEIEYYYIFGKFEQRHDLEEVAQNNLLPVIQ